MSDDTIDLTGKRNERKKKKGESKGRVMPVEVYDTLARLVEKDPGVITLPALPTQYRLFEPERGTRLFLSVQGEEVVIVSEQAIAHELVCYTRQHFSDKKETQLSYRGAVQAVEYIRSVLEPIPEPKMVAWEGEDCLTYRRLPWRLGAPQDRNLTPTWNDLLKRMTNADAFRRFIGSLFFEQSSTQQYVWVHGKGDDGKGAISRFLHRVLGAAYASKNPPHANDRFWTYGLIGKRLVVFADCNNQTFVTSGSFKSMTGGDPISVERKGMMSFTYTPKAKYLFLSNEKPLISSERSDTRRLILCEFEERTTEDDPTFEEKLWAEGGYFLSLCMSDYLAACPHHQKIPVDEQVTKDWLEVSEAHYAEVTHRCFVIGFAPEQTTHWITPIKLQSILRVEFKNNRYETHQYLAYLERKFGVKKKLVRLTHDFAVDKDVRAWVYSGLISKHPY